MSEVSYSTIKKGDTGKLVSVSVPYNPSMLTTDEQIALARQIHDDIQRQFQEWFDEEFTRRVL